MTTRLFAWDQAKNPSNLRKHGVSFETASRVFDDPLHVSVQDRVEDGEERWLTLGRVGAVTVLVVAHTITEDDPSEGDTPVEVVRIISARKAERHERRRYEEG